MSIARSRPTPNVFFAFTGRLTYRCAGKTGESRWFSTGPKVADLAGFGTDQV
jgi:hypothetical protein